MMTVYGIIVLLHVIAAVCGLGATFALPILMSRPKTAGQTRKHYQRSYLSWSKWLFIRTGQDGDKKNMVI
ncbi:hypothetical protein ACQCVE_15605 [Metabacillus sp. 113a]|uniref:hypothetical protein n=1 Tax=Metabacillus sp. 113a TaxID=3404706 RepID=UPI003CF7E28B